MKTAAIHQPYYLPWLGLFEKIRKSDVFVFLDNVTYSKNGYANRNRIKTPDGWHWLTVPVVNKNILQTPINDVKISNATNWCRKHWNSIQFNYGNAPFFENYKTFFKNVYEMKWELLAELNEYLIKKVCEFLGIETTFVNASMLDVEGTSTTHLVNICKILDANTYFSGSGGRNYLDCSLFEKEDINVIFQEFKIPPYSQLHGDFVPNLSVIDFLLNCGGK